MKKVKSRRAPATATRKAKVAAKPAKPARRTAAKPIRGGAKKRDAKKGGDRKGTKVAAPAKPALQIRELDPLRVCGERTSVMQLFRVDEQLVEGKVAGARQVHLVFNDRHGWYCEHGRSCHAVSAVMRHAGIR